MRLFSFLIVPLSILFAGCSMREEGPAEKFGRHIDELSTDLKDMSKDDGLTERERERARVERENAARDASRYENSSDYYRRPAPDADASANHRSGDKFDSRTKPSDYRY